MTQSAEDFLNDTATPAPAATLSAADYLDQAPEKTAGATIENALPQQGQALEPSNEVPHGGYTDPQEYFRQVGLAGRDLAGAVPMAVAGIGDVANTAINAATGAANKYAGTKIPPLAMPTDAVQKGLSATGDFPEPQNHVEKDVGTAASVLLGGGEQGVQSLKQAGSNLLDFFRGDGAATPQTSDAMKSIASDFYQQADEAGGTLKPQFTNTFIDNVSKLAPQTEEGKIVAGETPVTQLADRLQALRDKPISLQGAQEIDERLGNMVDKEYGPTGLSKDGKQLLDVQTNLRDMINSAGPDDLTGGDEGFQALQNGRDAWSQAAKMRDLEKIQTRADYSDNPATTIRSGVRTLLSNPARVRGYSDDELSALQDAAKTGFGVDTLRVFGSRLMPMIASAAGEATGGLPGAAIAGGLTHGVSTVARNAATNIQANRLQNVLKVLGQDYRTPGSAAPAPATPGVGNYLPVGAAATPLLVQPGGNQ